MSIGIGFPFGPKAKQRCCERTMEDGCTAVGLRGDPRPNPKAKREVESVLTPVDGASVPDR